MGFSILEKFGYRALNCSLSLLALHFYFEQKKKYDGTVCTALYGGMEVGGSTVASRPDFPLISIPLPPACFQEYF